MSSAYRRLWHRVGHTRWFAIVLRGGLSRVDGWLYRASRGRVSVAGALLGPVILLTTTGRRSGRVRTTPVFALRDGERFVVTSEHTGQDRPAAWPRNLDADPAATVQHGAAVVACRARRASAEEIERYWPRQVAVWPAHATYLGRGRQRHMFVLEPTE